MGKEQIKVIHIDTEKTWRGGQQQAAYLFEGMLNRGYDTLMLCKSGSAMQSYCQEKNLPYQTLDFAHELDFKSGKVVARIASNFGEGILHLHSGHAVSMGLWAKLFNRNLKLIASRRVDFSIKKHPLSTLKYNTRLLDHIVCISESIKQILIQDGITPRKLTVIHSGIDTHRFDSIKASSDLRKVWGIPDKVTLIGTVAAFSGHKDYPNFLKAAAIICSQRNDVWFMAVGDGTLLDAMKQLAEELHISDKVIFTGFQNNVGEFLKSFDIFVLSSKKEGLGTSVLDAMSVGLPIVATKAGGIPEMIVDGQNGLLVNVSDSEALSTAILKLIDNPKLAQELGANALVTVRTFDIDKTIESYLKLYAELSNE